MIMQKWHYHNPVRIYFGAGAISSLPDLIDFHKVALITTPGFSKRGTINLLRNILGKSLIVVFDQVLPNPTFTSVKTAFNNLQSFAYDCIVALGGGSTIDTAKAVAAIGGIEDKDLFEDCLKSANSLPETFRPKPIIAIPTTAGTGSEVTMWATIWDNDEKKKYSASHSLLYPKKAILDSELTLTLPEKETVNSGLDALSHAMESIWNKNHNPISDSFALEAIAIVYKYLPILRNSLANSVLRTHMLRASLFAGLAFSNTKTALAHSISYPLTAHFGLSHGLACSLPLPHVLKFNMLKSTERTKIIAKALGADTTVRSMVAKLTELFEKISLSLHLSDYGINKNKAELITNLAYTPGRADNNIAPFDNVDLSNIINSLF